MSNAEFKFVFVIVEHYAEAGWHEPWFNSKPQYRYELYVDGKFRTHTYSWYRLEKAQAWDKMCKNLSWHTHHRRGVIPDERPRIENVKPEGDVL